MTPLPPGATKLPRRDRVILAALLSGERHTIRSLADLTGTCISTTHKDLKRLRRRGLVTWEPHQARTLRPTVTVV